VRWNDPVWGLMFTYSINLYGDVDEFFSFVYIVYSTTKPYNQREGDCDGSRMASSGGSLTAADVPSKDGPGTEVSIADSLTSDQLGYLVSKHATR
jgi:hypothetical protein